MLSRAVVEQINEMFGFSPHPEINFCRDPFVRISYEWSEILGESLPMPARGRILDVRYAEPPPRKAKPRKRA
jgi:hypothetical protein